jgi:hypothetical protein
MCLFLPWITDCCLNAILCTAATTKRVYFAKGRRWPSSLTWTWKPLIPYEVMNKQESRAFIGCWIPLKSM